MKNLKSILIYIVSNIISIGTSKLLPIYITPYWILFCIILGYFINKFAFNNKLNNKYNGLFVPRLRIDNKITLPKNNNLRVFYCMNKIKCNSLCNKCLFGNDNEYIYQQWLMEE
jgi:hypothetical protein